MAQRSRPIEEDIWPTPPQRPNVTRRQIVAVGIGSLVVGAMGGRLSNNSHAKASNRSSQHQQSNSSHGSPGTSSFQSWAHERAQRAPNTWTKDVGTYCQALDMHPEDEVIWLGLLAMARYLAGEGALDDSSHVVAARTITTAVPRLTPPQVIRDEIDQLVRRISSRLLR